MQITHDNKTYTATEKDLKYYLDKCVPEWIKLGYMELIETKPCDHKGVHFGIKCAKCGQVDERLETKPEEKPTKYQEAKRKGDIARAKAERLVDHDKAMEIPEVEYCNPNLSDMEWRDKIVSSLNAVIKKINNL